MHALQAPANRIFKKDMAGASGVNYQLYLTKNSKVIENKMNHVKQLNRRWSSM